MQRKKRKNQASITDFWEQKLNINYDAEIEYYRKLCGLPYDIMLLRSNSEYDAETEYLSYQKWERHILSTVEGLNFNELETYLRFLNQKYRENNIIITLYHTALIPFAIAISGIVINFFTDNITKFIGIIILGYMSIAKFKDIIISEKQEEIVKNFYYDVKEIVEKNKRV